MTARTLVLLRHAKAEPENGLGDQSRPLASQGRRQAADLALPLAEQVKAADVALVSSALRTTETYKILAASWPGAPEAQVREELYSAGPREVIAVLAELPERVQRVIVVGHEPTMSSLAYLLNTERSELSQALAFGMGTAEAAVLEVPVAWDELGRSTAQLLTVVRPQ